MNFNEIQRKAIKSDVGKNLLISAGAGSGKTSVLTERVIDILRRNDANLSELLILTFTNAAAIEMKVRIKEALSKDNKLKPLVSFVDSAHIETYDAYRMFLVKKYGYLIDLGSDINVLDNDIFHVKKRGYIEEILIEEYEKDSEHLHTIVDKYLDRNDKDLIDFISSIVDVYPYLNEKDIEKYKIEFLSDSYFENFKNEVFNKIKALAKQSYDTLPDGKKGLAILKNSFLEILNCSKLEDMFALGDNPFKGGSVAGKNKDVVKEHFIDNRKEIKKYLNKIDLELLKEDISLHKQLIPYVLEIALKASKKLNEFKKINSFFTFNDIALFANEILEKNPNIQKEIKNSFKEIMIDEYQDTSELDEKFISYISNDNVFCVGDVKQSIYLFRGAQPENFKKRSDDYKKKNSNGTFVAMKENYRSRKEVIDFINDLFAEIMTEESSSITYKDNDKDNEELKTANNDLQIIKNKKQKYGFFALSYVKPKKKNENEKTDDESEENNEQNEEVLDINDTEAKLMAEDILKRIHYKEQVYSKSDKKLKNIEYKDIAILLEKKTKLERIEETFKEYGIPLNIFTTESLFVNDVILTIISLLNFVYEYQNFNKTNKYILRRHFVSIARSFLFEYTDQKIYELITKSSYDKDALYLRLVDFAKNNKNLLLSNLFSNLLQSFNFFENVGKFRDPVYEVGILNLLYNKTKQLDQLQYTLEDFVSYLTDLDSLGLTIDVNKRATSDNAVQLMTIHKSKGLQFNVVYFPQLAERTRHDTQTFRVSKDLGIWFPFFSNRNGDYSYIYKYRDKTEELEKQERIRKFYVALTRVIEVGIFILGKDESGEFKYGLGKYLNGRAIPESPYKEKKEIKNSTKQDIPEGNIIKFKKLNKDFKLDTKQHVASKPIDEDIDESLLLFGTHMHEYMETVDFNTKDVSFIKDAKERKIIKNVLNLQIFQNLHGVKIYKEYQFYDSINNITGVIDLMLVYNNHIKIIDYKAKNINDEGYKQQLSKYKDYIERIFKLNVECYLLSLLDARLEKIL